MAKKTVLVKYTGSGTFVPADGSWELIDNIPDEIPAKDYESLVKTNQANDIEIVEKED